MLKIDKELKDYLRISLLADLFEATGSDDIQKISDSIIKGLEKYDVLDQEFGNDAKIMKDISSNYEEKLAA
tara:strand:+ start:272 stop:484 length:213 start_codon:yes stop_codon:yes gene_type:complete